MRSLVALGGPATPRPTLRYTYFLAMNKRVYIVHLLVICGFALIIYARALDAPFIWDSQYLIERNPIVQDLSYFAHPEKARQFGMYDQLRTRYVGFLTFALNYWAHGNDVTGFRLVNLFIHIANALLVYALVLLTCSTPSIRESVSSKRAQWLALLAGVMFAAHPVQVEAVMYVVQRAASLAAFFSLSALVLYAASRLSEKKLSSALMFTVAVLSMTIAMKTKENAFLVPLGIALYESLFFRGSVRGRLARLAPFILTMAIVPFSRFGLERLGADLVPRLGMPEIPAGDYALTQLSVVVTYLRLILFPLNQNIDYDYPLYGGLALPVVFGILVHAGLLWAAVYMVRGAGGRNPQLRLAGFGVLWFYLTLLVESSFISIAMLINEYRMYLPSAGLFAGLAVLAGLAYDKLQGEKLRRVFVSAIVVMVAALSVMTINRAALWKDDVRLWEDASRKSPFKGRPLNNLGAAHADRGEFRQAVRVYMRALKLDPSSTETYVNLGNIFSDMGDISGALAMYGRASAIEPDSPGIYFNMGVVHERMGDRVRAIELYERALALDPGYTYPAERIRLLRESGGVP